MLRCSCGGTRRAAAAALLAVLAAVALPLASALMCESYRTPAECKGQVTDSGYCGWTDGACHAVKPLSEGVFAIALVDDDDRPISSAPPKPAAAAAAPAPVPAPRAEGSLGRHTLQTIVVKASSGPAPTEAAASSDAPPATTDPAAPCEDIPTPEGFTCAQQAAWGKCAEPWMVEGGFCRATCGHCEALPAPAGAEPVVEQARGPADAVFCTQAPERGPCRAAIPSWYFDAGMAECRPFLYGGCQGNDNRFDSFDACAEAAARFCMA